MLNKYIYIVNQEVGENNVYDPTKRRRRRYQMKWKT
jgi:hypothetical protein